MKKLSLALLLTLTTVAFTACGAAETEEKSLSEELSESTEAVDTPALPSTF